MSRHYVVIGSVPYDEPCAQVGRHTYDQMFAETKFFRDALADHFRERHGELTDNLRVRRFGHEFGDYCEVVCYFRPGDEDTENFAYEVEESAPSRWSEYRLKRPAELLEQSKSYSR